MRQQTIVKRIVLKRQQLRSVYRERGVTGLIIQVARELIASIYHYEMQYVLGRVIEARRPHTSLGDVRNHADIECMIVESPESLREVESEIPSSFRDSVGQLKDRLERGCVVILARQLWNMGSGRKVIGYAICQRGVFSALGRKKRVASDILFLHYIEVLPERRGHWIGQVISRSQDQYCRVNGLTRHCCVVSPDNRASIQSQLRAGSKIIGTVERVEVLRRLFVWETPWKTIRKALVDMEYSEHPSNVPIPLFTAGSNPPAGLPKYR